jgi:hypothetical protein
MDTNQTNRSEAFKRLYPELADGVGAAARERFERYIKLAVEIAVSSGDRPFLTTPTSGANLTPGQVDPGTFTKTG